MDNTWGYYDYAEVWAELRSRKGELLAEEYNLEEIDLLKAAMQAVDKQIIRPVSWDYEEEDGTTFGIPYCPTCTGQLANDDENYCVACGQALKWAKCLDISNQEEYN